MVSDKIEQWNTRIIKVNDIYEVRVASIENKIEIFNDEINIVYGDYSSIIENAI